MKDGTMPWLHRDIDLCSYVCARVQTHRAHAPYTVHAKRPQSCVFIKTNSRINVSLDIWYLLLLCVSKKKALLITPLYCSVWHFWLWRELPHLNAAAASLCIVDCTKQSQTFMSTLLMQHRLYRLGHSGLLLAILKVTLMEQPLSCWGFSLSFTHALTIG